MLLFSSGWYIICDVKASPWKMVAHFAYLVAADNVFGEAFFVVFPLKVSCWDLGFNCDSI